MALVAACLLVPPFLGASFPSMVIASVLATGALLGLVPLVPFLTHHVSRLVAQISFLSQDIVLGVRNVRDNKSLMNNIQLFSAAIAIVAFMASMFATMGADLVKSYAKNKYNLTLVLRQSNPKSLAALANTDGVEAYAGSYQWHAPILNHGTYLNVLVGIDGPDFFKFAPVDQLEANQEALASLNQGKNIITANVLKGKLGLKLGDTLVLELAGKEVGYTITGFVETNWGIGHVGYISAENYKADMGVPDYSVIYIQTGGQADTVKNNVLRTLNKEVISIQTQADLLAANADKVIAVFNAINSYCYPALLVGLIGVVNNLVASFIGRIHLHHGAVRLREKHPALSDGWIGQGHGGCIRVNGVELQNLTDEAESRIRRNDIGFVFQAYNLIDNLTLEENITLPALLERKNRREVLKKAAELMDRVGILKRRNHTPKELSGGEQQRTAIARALINDPAILFADEPIGNLDSQTGKEILELLRHINAEKGIAILMVTHSEESACYGKRIIRLKDGQVLAEHTLVPA